MMSEGVKLFRRIDHSKCIGCEICSAVCEFIHDGISLIRVCDIGGKLLKSISCFHCINPLCAETCPTEAIRIDELGVAYIDESKCNGCTACLYACPFGIPELDPKTKTAKKCDLCMPLRRNGLQPACVAMCPAKAITLLVTQKVAVRRR